MEMTQKESTDVVPRLSRASWRVIPSKQVSKTRAWNKEEGQMVGKEVRAAVTDISVELGSLVLACFGLAVKGDLGWLEILCVKWKLWPGDVPKRSASSERNQGARRKRASMQGIEKWYREGSSPVGRNTSWYSTYVRHYGGSWKNENIATIWLTQRGCPGGLSGKEPTCQRRRPKRRGFIPRVRKISRRRAWNLTPVCLPGGSHGQRSRVGYSPRGCKELDMTEWLSMT